MVRSDPVELRSTVPIAKFVSSLVFIPLVIPAKRRGGELMVQFGRIVL
jgi:hypothetical protein